MVGEVGLVNRSFLCGLHVAWQKLLFFLALPTKAMFQEFNTLASFKVVKKLSVVIFLPEPLQADQIQNCSLTNVYLSATIR